MNHYLINNADLIEAPTRRLQAKEYLSQAIDQANKGYTTSAIEAARNALFSAKGVDAVLTARIHCMLANLFIDTGKFKVARIHGFEARQLALTTGNQQIPSVAYFDRLLEMISAEEKRTPSVSQNSNLAA